MRTKPIIPAILIALFLNSCSSSQLSSLFGSGDKNSFSLVAVGDISHSHTSDYVAEFKALGKKKYIPTRKIISSADLSFANLETPYTTREPVLEKQFAFASDPEELDHILWAGFNLLSLANNHSHDAGQAGIVDTIELLQKKKRTGKKVRGSLTWAGTGRTFSEAREPKFIKLPGKNFKIAFLAYGNNSHSLVNTFEVQRAANEIQKIKRSDPNTIIIVSVHSGTEYRHVPGSATISYYRTLIDAGAQVILGHHPHVLQGIEQYRNGIIFYSLGNFSFGSYTSRHIENEAKLYGMIARMDFRRINSTLDIRLVAYPLYVDNVYPMIVNNHKLEPTPFVPQVVQKPFSKPILDSIISWSNQIPGNDIRLSSDGTTLNARIRIDL
ncbi:MAG: CapA family protein [Spirochaetes bacterium]|nr:CapA family protein [Spirochaetota bacterium]MBN2769360.1 CapA family protein [Spirochaetota bacterium]